MEKKLPNRLKLRKNISFKIDPELGVILKQVINKSDFINKSIKYFLTYLRESQKVLTELKERNPELYKKIGRRKFNGQI